MTDVREEVAEQVAGILKDRSLKQADKVEALTTATMERLAGLIYRIDIPGGRITMSRLALGNAVVELDGDGNVTGVEFPFGAEVTET